MRTIKFKNIDYILTIDHSLALVSPVMIPTIERKHTKKFKVVSDIFNENKPIKKLKLILWASIESTSSQLKL